MNLFKKKTKESKEEFYKEFGTTFNDAFPPSERWRQIAQEIHAVVGVSLGEGVDFYNPESHRPK